MKIIVNGNPVNSVATNLADLLIELGVGDDKVATAVNEQFVPVPLRYTQNIAENDRIEIVSPRQGG